MDNQVIVASIGAVVGALITSLIAPYILQSNVRKIAKAEVLKILMEVELARWSDSSYEDYKKKQIELKATVLIANGSRPIADNYSKMAAVARSFSDLDADDHEFSGEGGIPMDIARCVDDAAALLSHSAWTPRLLRPFLRVRLRTLKKNQERTRDQYKNKRGQHCWDTRII